MTCMEAVETRKWNMEAGADTDTLGLYVHIPFCVEKCRYCDFLSFGGTSEEIQATYVEGLIREITVRGELYRRRGEMPLVDTVFIGGGTPSILPVSLTERILTAIRESFILSKEAEITTEANPGTLDREKLAAYRALGINRLSMGVQTLDPELLRFLGRIHTVEDFYENFRQAREAGFDNINPDLIFALPGQTLKQWEATLEGILQLAPEHLSFYSLQIEEGTPFFEMFRRGEIRQASDELDRAMYHLTLDRLEDAGYRQYEISNAARQPREGGALTDADNGGRDFRCRHNLKYWSMENYLGLGLGAHSYLREQGQSCGRRFANHGEMGDYLNAAKAAFMAMSSGTLCDDTADLFHVWNHCNSLEEERSDYFFTELRRRSGVGLADYENRFGEAMEERYGAQINRFLREGLLEAFEERRSPAGIRLTRKGMDLASTVIREFI